MTSTDAKKPGPVIWVPLLACFFWLVLTLALYRQASQVDEAHRLELEHTRLSTVARQLMDARNWNATHGGVYVLKSEYGQPNPWLPEGERTLATEDGRTLVLMNPAYMSRQLAERSSEPGIGISIISNVPLRPENKADTWESGALGQCTEEAREVFSAPGEDGQGKLRLLSVLVAQESCLRCHLGRKVGEVLGGISVSQDADVYLHNVEQQQRNMQLLYSLLGLTGVLAIGGLTLNLTRRRWLAEETSRMKSAFMARLSHDMRTPLTAILGMSELLQQKGMQEQDRKKALRYLSQAGSALLEMVRDVTDHASLEQGALQLRPASFALRAALEDCMALFRPVAEAKGLDIDLDVNPDLPDAVVGDCFRLRQALGNLVSNAVKFTELGRVRVCVEPAGRKAGGINQGAADILRLKIMVQDTGPGLPEEDAERIFESFQRGSDNPSVPGTGLGLYISRTIARRMGGDVTVISSPGRGSCFTLELCLQLPSWTDQKKKNGECGQQEPESAAGEQNTDGAQASACGSVGGPALSVASAPDCRPASGCDRKMDTVPGPESGPEAGSDLGPELGPEMSATSGSESAPAADPEIFSEANTEIGSEGHSEPEQTAQDKPVPQQPVVPVTAPSVTACTVQGNGAGVAMHAQASSAQSGCFEGRRILVAEDNEANRYIMEHMLRAEGACVRMARDGKSALAALDDGPWDMVILDARMPDMGGLEVLQAVRAGHTAVSPRQKIIIYTAALDAEDRQRSADLEADMVLLKPLTFASLRKELASLLPARARNGMGQDGESPDRKCQNNAPACGQAASGAPGMPCEDVSCTEAMLAPSNAACCSGPHSASDRCAAVSVSNAPHEEALMPWNRQEALAALDHDPELLLQLAEVLRKDLQTRGAHLEAALGAGDAYNLRRLAHAVKNSAGTMRFDVLHARAGDTENAQEADLEQAAAHMRRALQEALAMLDEYLGVEPDANFAAGKAAAPECDPASAGRKGDC
ncbi:MAG: ATP-binding protein [Desulfovibrio sp.]|uniref:ATP-binding protein n=1 Tax=Desulfovibrio sp. TaxID=885 RepID=UPI0039E21B61